MVRARVMKSVLLSLGLATATTWTAQASEVQAVTPDSFDSILGTDWTGSLTYMNYQEPFEDVTIPAALEVAAVEGGFEFAYKYPDEPHANSTSLVALSAGGSVLMDQPVTANEILADGTQQITTAFACEDMGKSASCEMIYTLSSDRLSMRKMVTYEDEAQAFRRNEYNFVR